MSDEPKETNGLITGNCEKGIHLVEDNGESSHIHPMADGEPLPPGASLIEVEAHTNSPYCKVRTLFTNDEGHDGPVRVSSPAFRTGWDNIFGNGAIKKEDLN